MTEETERPEMAENADKKPKRQRSRADDNVVFVGRKPTMAYVLAVITQFSGGTNEVHLKARGKSISRAVDVAEVVKNRFLTNIKHKIAIGTERVQGEGDRGELNVSTIDITLAK